LGRKNSAQQPLRLLLKLQCRGPHDAKKKKDDMGHLPGFV
jgi:hypothetical protein